MRASVVAISGLLKNGVLWFCLYTAGVVAVLVWTTQEFWYLFVDEPKSEVLRNVTLAAAGLVALGLGTWRSVSAKRQADVAQRGLLDERFQRAMELLSDDRELVKASAVQMLGKLAAEDAQRYNEEVLSLLNGRFQDTSEERYAPPYLEAAVDQVRKDCERRA